MRQDKWFRLMDLVVGLASLGAMESWASASYTFEVHLSATHRNSTPETAFVDGSITVDRLGSLTAADVVDYSLTFSAAGLPSTTLTPSVGRVSLTGDASLIAGASALTVALPNSEAGADFQISYPNIQNLYTLLDFSTEGGSPAPNVFSIFYKPISGVDAVIGSTYLSDGGTYLVGTAVVPEPSSLALCGIASLLGFGYARTQARGISTGRR